MQSNLRKFYLRDKMRKEIVEIQAREAKIPVQTWSSTNSFQRFFQGKYVKNITENITTKFKTFKAICFAELELPKSNKPTENIIPNTEWKARLFFFFFQSIRRRAARNY